ncbi:ethanolamine ammonia-lyase subunit EutB [Acidipropionibacterium jensenii]|uniref:ethanolamine ammonia-lyase subunit EutB n=1 Tax=Acidipropionibacterium jensenii TaxID=1749 RepID=UPI0026497A0B|nr:ethanolamine ammonia-lyase subunit EutB [Acidipropionibacterium jensenii]MDN5976682.1 ethanolamine ammonia-lyase subunit EutB [Acidipropionibacterium jensenii]MDN5996295.1 ethanolamine ammonia-lyase subunit EutB [Acidipropionibacterium jensenii]MDN6427418.1 ethanolamine ammonia-lyase subunit EutB [Acidipropionibacterium jensenii]MDN6440831.1 ethanolamine ammonia-lyase subunit EutB [Acidipropionibacterium jensenii]MDN6479273.1 ethanolamine ammonia-lyase subunit EutB [Acidipropionibacterium j
MRYSAQAGGHRYSFDSLAVLMGAATPARSGDELAGCAAGSAAERAAAQRALSEVPLTQFLTEDVIDRDTDDVTRLILAGHDPQAFAPVSSMSVGQFRDWLLAVCARPDASQVLAALKWGLTPEMVAAVSKLMTVGEMIAVSSAITVVTGFRSTIGRPGTLATRLQPNDPTDDPAGVAAVCIDGLLMGSGDAVVGVNPASDSPRTVRRLLDLLDGIRSGAQIPTQTCVLTHVTTTIDLIEAGAPVDLVFQSIAGTQAANEGFGVTIEMLREADQAAHELARGTVGDNVMYFETGQGSALSADAHHGVGGVPVDQQTLEARAYGLAREFNPLLLNTVVGFIGPEYLYDGRQIIRAGIEDNFCGRLLGVPMGVDVCYTNHVEADADDMSTLLTLLVAARTGYVICVPGTDDIMLGYQSLSFHDVLTARRVAGLRPAPEFDSWLDRVGLLDESGRVRETALPAAITALADRSLAA